VKDDKGGYAMPLRKLNIADVKPFSYGFEPPMSARMADIGRAVGSQTVGLAIQIIEPGKRSSRRHRHVFQEAHAFDNTGSIDLVIWAFGNRFPHEVCVYPDENIAFVEGLGADVPLDSAAPSEWTEAKRQR
jgi:uncharacterized cupin superfamily protein